MQFNEFRHNLLIIRISETHLLDRVRTVHDEQVSAGSLVFLVGQIDRGLGSGPLGEGCPRCR